MMLPRFVHGFESYDATMVEFPAPLTESDFNPKAGFQVIEFFSPYCPHCKSLAPIWKDSWETFYEEGRRQNISLLQVDCVESGDLCKSEKIMGFPSIRLYGPNGFIESFPKYRTMSKDNILDFARQAVDNPDDMEDQQIGSLSELVTAEKFANLLAGKGQQPYLLSFWPAKNARSADGNIDFKNCDECDTFQKGWKTLSVKLAALDISTGHLNCESSAAICTNLGFSSLVKITNHRVDRIPKVALVVPEKTTNNFFTYDGPFSTKMSVYEDFAKRTYFNSRIMTISSEEIVEITQKEYKLSGTHEKKPQKLHLVYSYNRETAVPEDLQFLQSLVDPVSKISNAYLYITEEDLTPVVVQSFESMYEMINYNTSEPEKRLKEEYIDFNIMPDNPNFFIFRDGDKIPHTFQGYSTTELRNTDTIMDWVREYSLPMVNEVTPDNFAQILAFNSEMYDGVAIILINTIETELTNNSNEHLDKLRVGYYDYEHVRMGKMIEDVSVKRERRLKKANRLKEKGYKKSTILEAAREEILHEDNKKVIISFLDISKYSSILNKLGVTHVLSEDDIGKVILYDKYTKSYHKKDIFGNDFIAEPYTIRETLSSVFLSQKPARLSRIAERLFGPLFCESLKNFDSLVGVSGYAIFIVLILGCLKGIKICRRKRIGKRYKAKRDVIGLLGKNGNKKSLD